MNRQRGKKVIEKDTRITSQPEDMTRPDPPGKKERISSTDEFANICLTLNQDFGFTYLDIYAPDDEIVGILFSKSEELVEEFSKIELQSCKESVKI